MNVTLTTLPVVNLALQQTDVPLVSRLSLKNTTGADVGPVRVRVALDPAVAPVWERTLQFLRAGEEVVFDAAEAKLDLSYSALAAMHEVVRGTLTLTVEHGTEVVRETRALTVHPADWWFGASLHPESLATFVRPNHPALAPLLAAVREVSPAAVWRALAGRVALRDGGALAGGARMTPLDEVAAGAGTSLDLALLYASLAERVGLRPVVVVLADRALLGVLARDATLPATVVTESEPILKRVSDGRLLLADPAALVRGLPFDDATRLAHATYFDTSGRGPTVEVVCAVDVAQCRTGNASIRPLDGIVGIPTDSEFPLVDFERPRPSVALPAPVVASTPLTAAEQRIARWKARLLDLSLRNPLLNFRPQGNRVLPIAIYTPEDLENFLSNRDWFSLGAPAETGKRSDKLFEQRTGRPLPGAHLNDLLMRHILLPDLPPDEAARIATEMFRQARLAKEETGSSNLWLAIGMLEWHEAHDPKKKHLAPILLYPVELARGDKPGAFKLRWTDEEPRVNATLLKLLESELHLDVTGQSELPDDEHGKDVALVLARIGKLVAGLEGFRVVTSAAVAFFSFAKHMMWLDLESRSEALRQNAVVAQLLGDGDTTLTQKPFVEARALDAMSAADDLTVVDSDSSQLRAVRAAVDGNTFVLEGPPGTGKSQTITNMVAELVANGQSVLFVAEKRAAIEVVRDRLRKVGLGAFCLDLHDHDASKLDTITALAEPLELARDVDVGERARIVAELDGQRAALDETWRALHAPGAAEVSVWQAVAKLDELGTEPHVQHDFDGRDASRPLTAERWHALVAATHGFATAAAIVGRPTMHAFASSRMSDWNPRRETAIDKALAAARDASAPVANALRGLAKNELTLRAANRERLARLADFVATERPVPDGAAGLLAVAADADARRRLAEAAELERRRTLARETLAQRWSVDALLSEDTTSLEPRFIRWASAFVLFAFFALFFARRRLKRAAIGELPPNADIGRDLGIANALRADQQQLATREPEVRLALGDARTAAEVASRIATLPARLAWCERRRTTALALVPHVADPSALERAPGILAPELVAAYVEARATLERTLTTLAQELELDKGPLDGEATLTEIDEHVTRWSDELRELRDWSAYVRARAAMEQAGLAVFVQAFELGRVAAAELERAFTRSAMIWRVEDALANVPTLGRFQGRAHEDRVREFSRLDGQRQELARVEVMRRLVARLPDGKLDVGEVGTLRAEQKKKRRHMPLRKLFAKIPTILPRLKPCVLMSPMSVAQYLDPELKSFDVVVFDEASQIPPWEAIGALARGTRAVIVGDSKQMPPTAFFGKTDDEDEDDVEEMESILDECERAGLPKMSLKWHYRSRHPSLIQFSNQRYYDSQLVTFPAAAARVPTLGVKWMPVDGQYDKGGSRSNRAEADVVVREVVRRLASDGTKSIGIVTFSLPQRDLIEELIDAERAAHPEIDKYFDAKQVGEPVFIKNLENVQGDERDVIIFSMSYGPDKDGKVALNFGALNRSGGERRLNVAVTRARESLLVVSSLRPEHIGEGRTSALGVRHLREFLDFAQRDGQATSAEEAALREKDNAGCVAAIEAKLAALGYQSDRNIGAPGPRVDLAVQDPDAPGHYLLGIVTDSPVWARFPSVRDREKLGPSVLARQGWRLHRIWSLDWWHDADREIAKIIDQLALAREAARLDREIAPAPASASESEPAPSSAPEAAPEAALDDAPDWFAGERWRASHYERIEPVDLAAAQPTTDPLYHRHVAERLIAVVQAEGPIYREDAIRRAYDAWSPPRLTKNMQQAVLDQLRHLPLAKQPKLVDDVFWPSGLDPTAYTTFRVAKPEDDARPADSIPLVEVRNASLAVLSRAFSLDEDQLIGQLMQIFGVARRGPKVVEHFRSGIALAVDAQHATREDTTLTFHAG